MGNGMEHPEKGERIGLVSDGKSVVKCFVKVLPVIIMVFISLETSAQTGTISGQVSDNLTEKPLPGTIMAFDTAEKSIVADLKSRYLLRDAQPGSYFPMIRLPDYAASGVKVSFDSREYMEQNLMFDETLYNEDRIFSVAKQRSQAMALSGQRESLEIKSVITSDQMDRFSDISISSAMARVPGVQKGSRGALSLRGVGRGMYYVTMEGTRMGYTGTGDRSFDLSYLSADMVQELEVIKVLTPYMDADGLAGAVNIVTRRPAGGERILNARIGGMANTEYVIDEGPGSRTSFEYAEAVREDFFIALNLDHQRENTGFHSLGIDFDALDFGSGPVDVVRNVSPGLHLEARSRLASMLKLSFQPSDNATYYLQGMINYNDRGMDYHSFSWRTTGEWVNATTPEQGEGTYHYDLQRQETQVRQYTVRTGARYLFPQLSLDYSLGWGYSDNNQLQLFLPFEADLDYSLNMADRSRPEILIDGVSPGILDTRLQVMNRVQNQNIDQKYSGRVNAEIPFSLGAFKLGSSALLTNKSGNYNNATYQNLRSLNISNFELRPGGTLNVFEQYHFPWTLDSHDAMLFFENSLPSFRKNEELRRSRTDIWNNEASENVYAGYGMVTLEFDRFVLIGGARFEQTDANYEGRRALFNVRGRYVTTVDTSQSVSYTNLFPHAQLAYSPTNRFNVRLAYSKSMIRQNFNYLAPFELVNPQDTTLFRGNPQLSPMFSDNIDLLFDYYFENIGHFGVNLFYKELSGYIYERQQILEIQEGDVSGFEGLFNEETTTVQIYDRQYQNSEETATIFGLEVSWQQNLGFLPGYLSNLSTYANYTWSHSEFDADDRNDAVALPAQSPHVVNMALEYTQGRFSGQAAYHWTAPSVQQLQRTAAMAPAIDPTQPVYMDWYQDGWTDVSLSMRYRVTNSFRIWIDAFNLLNVERVQYEHTRDLYPRVIDISTGRGLRAGIRYDL